MLKNTYYLILLLSVLAALVVGLNIGKGMQNPQTIEQEQTPTPTSILVEATNAPSSISALQTPSSSSGSIKQATTSGSPKGTLYTSTSCGITITYPDTVKLEESSTQTFGAVFTSKANPTDMVVLTCQKDIPKPPLPAQNIETFMIGSVEGNLYHDSSAKDGAKVDALIFTHPKNNMDVFIGGYGTTFNTIIQSIKIQ